MTSSIRIKFSSYDHKILDRAVKSVILTINKSGCKIRGAIVLPTKLQRYVVNNSHHIYKRSKFIMKRTTHSRLIIIDKPTPELMSVLNEIKIDEMISTTMRESKPLAA